VHNLNFGRNNVKIPKETIEKYPVNICIESAIPITIIKIGIFTVKLFNLNPNNNCITNTINIVRITTH
jgi:hypothetical protein